MKVRENPDPYIRGKMDDLKYWLSSLADLALPRYCIVCGRKLETRERHLCIYCSADFPFTRFWMSGHNEMADRYNAMISRDMDSGECTLAYEEYSRATALFFYHAEAGYRKIPQALKYGGRITAGRYFARILAGTLFSSDIFANVDMVVPVPLHRRRMRERGYNQAEVIAREIAVYGGIEERADLLVRRKYTQTQTRLSPEDKRTNVRGAFEVEEKVAEKCAPSHVLVVDDVFTTGATVTACHHALRRYFGFGLRISAATLGFVNSG